jgi:hypothetical protein
MGNGAPRASSRESRAIWHQGSYLLDFHRVCEYLSETTKAIEQQPAVQQTWLMFRRAKAITGTLA